MAKMFGFIACSLLLASTHVVAQDRSQNVWVIGENVRMDLNTGEPTFSGNAAITGREAFASISDPETGELQLYSNGRDLWNGQDELLTEDKQLRSGSSASQGVMIIPTGIGKRYFVFTTDQIENRDQRQGAHYSIVDMQLNDGRGGFVPGATDISLFTNASEGMAAVHHRDLCSFWLVFHSRSSNEFYAFRIEEETVFPAVVSRAGPSVDGQYDPATIKLSPDGSKIVFRVFSGSSEFFLMDFDNASGEVRNSRSLYNSDYQLHYGFEFSPDSQKLYMAAFSHGRSVIARYDQLDSPSPASSVSITHTISDAPPIKYVGALQRGSDGRIYTPRTKTPGGNMLAIENPNAANPTVREYELPGGLQMELGLPTFYSGISLISSELGPVDLIAEPVVNICSGKTFEINIDPTLEGIIEWEPAPGILDLNARTQTLAPEVNTRYIVHYTFACQTVSDTVSFVVAPSPQIAVEQPSVICEGESVFLNASGAESYSWAPTDGLDDPLSATPQASPTETTIYTVTGESANGCSASAEITVVVLPELTLSATPANPRICDGQSTNVKIESNVALRSVRWEPLTGVADPTAAETEITVSANTRYQVFAESEDGCLSSIEVTVTVDTFAPANLQPAVPQVCAGQDLQLQLESAVALTSVRWSPATGLSNPNIVNPVFNLDVSQSYTVEYESVGGCAGELTAFVEVFERPQLTIDKPQLRLCPGFTDVVIASGADTYRWLDMDGDEVANTAAWEVPVTQASGTFLVIGESADGCTAETVFEFVRLRGVDAPLPTEFNICFGESLELSAAGGDRYEWSPSTGLSDAAIQNPIASPESDQEYTLQVFSADGCSDVTSVKVNVAPQATVDVSLATPEPQIMPGDIIDLDVDITSRGPQPQNAGPQFFRIEIKCPARALRLTREPIRLSPEVAAWNIQAAQVIGDDVLVLEGTSDGGPIPAQFSVKLQMQAMLVSDFTVPLSVSLLDAALDFAPDCLSLEGAHELTWSEICLQRYRGLQFSGAQFGLMQNIPNPANAATQINYSLGFDTQVQLLLTDNLGRVVKTLVDQRQAGGDYTLDLDLADLARGDYRYVLKAGPFRDSRLLLVR